MWAHKLIEVNDCAPQLQVQLWDLTPMCCSMAAKKCPNTNKASAVPGHFSRTLFIPKLMQIGTGNTQAWSVVKSRRKFPYIFASKADDFSVALFFPAAYPDVKARWFVHSSTDAVIMLIEVKGRSVGRRNAEGKKNISLQN